MPSTIEHTDADATTRPDDLTVAHTPWNVVVWNDPVNLMTYVSYVFRRQFGYDHEKAERLMLTVHHDGRAIVATGGREQMERHVVALHEYGLWATLDRAES